MELARSAGQVGTRQDVRCYREPVQVRLLERVADVDSLAWDAIAGDHDPFVEHAFLHALEESGSVGEDAGWIPQHLTVWEDERLVAALPLYLKDHSFGEFIFDWAWAQAAERIGIPYYPKLVGMAPLTPATGTRLLVAPARDPRPLIRTLIDAALDLADRTHASSLHLLFLSATERDLVGVDERLRPRLSHQFHWHNDDYEDFEHYLSAFRSSMRKQVRRERRRVAEVGLDIRVVEGVDLTEGDWDALRRFYVATCRQHGSHAYLTSAFFDIAKQNLGRRAFAVFACTDGVPIAGTLCFEKGSHLYGRYWGYDLRAGWSPSAEALEFLHFELCYYRLIERAIERRLERFEAGAQGMHKLRRGMMPSPIYSAHWVRHPILSAAVHDFLPREAAAAAAEIAALAHHGPFRRSDATPGRR